MNTRIKVCGITSIEDAAAIAQLGADEIGLNFFPRSPRYIDVETACRITAEIPSGIRKVGVFVNASVDEIVNCADTVGLDAIQLHGDESDDFVRHVRARTGRFIIKALHLRSTNLPGAFDATLADAVLIDAPHTGEYGGTGQNADWDLVREHRDELSCLYLAGGLGPENVAAAIRKVRPNAVDACSRLESSKGRKDLTKVEEFIREVRQAS